MNKRKSSGVNELIYLNRIIFLTLSWRRPISYRNQSIDLFLYDNDLRHERVKKTNFNAPIIYLF